MLMYTAKRLLAGIITVWFIATATFIAMHQVPGDPLMNDKAVSAEIRANLERKYGLDKPVTEQYVIYLSNMLQGDFGISFTQQNRKVNDIIRDHFPVSATLGILAVLFAAFGGVLWGALTALYRNRLPDIIIMFLVILGISVPSFVFAAPRHLPNRIKTVAKFVRHERLRYLARSRPGQVCKAMPSLKSHPWVNKAVKDVDDNDHKD